MKLNCSCCNKSVTTNETINNKKLDVVLCVQCTEQLLEYTLCDASCYVSALNFITNKQDIASTPTLEGL